MSEAWRQSLPSSRPRSSRKAKLEKVADLARLLVAPGNSWKKEIDDLRKAVEELDGVS